MTAQEFKEKLLDLGYIIRGFKSQKTGGWNIEIENPAGSFIDLYFEEDGKIETASYVMAIDSEEVIDFLGTFIPEGSHIDDFPFDYLLDW